MKATTLNSPKLFARRKAAPPDVNRGFTLIELLVVIAIIAVLAAILLPALAAAKTRALRMQCMSQMKQLDLGMNAFTGDHEETYPPAGYQGASAQISWDTLIYSYIGGGSGVDPAALDVGVFTGDLSDNPAGLAGGLKVLTCPADTAPKLLWTPDESIRTYAMNSAGKSFGVDIQIPVSKGLPNLYQPNVNRHGVGIYWEDSAATPNWSAPGYPVSVVRDPAGTILLCEDASSQGAEGNIWPCCCVGPQISDGTSGGWGNLYQTDLATAGFDMAKFKTGGYSEGLLLYAAHAKRFNYAFHDGHVDTLKMEDTLGTASGPPAIRIQNPRGMWTVIPAD